MFTYKAASKGIQKGGERKVITCGGGCASVEKKQVGGVVVAGVGVGVQGGHPAICHNAAVAAYGNHVAAPPGPAS